MTGQPDNRRSACPISFTLDLVGDKWTLLVIRDLMFRGKQTYGEFLESGEGIATNILADRLKRLEQGGVIAKVRGQSGRGRSRYQLTDKGLSLLPLLLEMVLWGTTHDPDTGAPPAFVKRIRQDRAAVAREVLESLRAKK